MKTTINNIKHLCVLLLSALTLAACSSHSDEIVNLPEPSQPTADGIRFTALFNVKNASTRTTRALTDPNDGTLTASWQEGEQIAIVFGGAKYTAEVTAVTDGIATVSATLPNGTPNNQAVTFIYPASAADGSGLRSGLLAKQDGTLATLSSQLDVATADGNIVVDGSTAHPNGTVRLENHFAICKLQFKDESNQDITDIANVTITDLATQEEITVTTPSAQSAVYVAMNPTNNSVKFVVEGYDGRTYIKTATSNLQAGLFYHPTLTTSCIFNAKSTPLTFEAIENCEIKFHNYADGSLHYTIEGGESGEFQSYGDPDKSFTLTAGQKVSFYGDNATYGDYHKLEGSTFEISGDCYVYGNIMSMISSTDYTDLKELPEDGNFIYLFNGCSHLKSHPDKQLLLPATTLTNTCYCLMFNNCSSLTKAPALPATALEQYCYSGMFWGCTSLTKAPALPATTLAEYCYDAMFGDCTSLTKAPDLPATTLVEGCYGYMFIGCLQLNSVKCLATNISATRCTEKWLEDVASSGTFTKAAGVAWGEGMSGIPSGWTVVEATE